MAETNIPRTPVATYRLQFRNGMTFDKALQLIPHWTSLGVSHLYASPIFAAVTGSTHGYDVTDPNAIDADIGGSDGFRRLSDGLLAADIGLILDIVPNHMAASLENPHWRDALKLGRHSPSAPVFDNDWHRKLTLPVLDGPLQGVIQAGDARLKRLHDTGEIVFDCYGSHYPIDPATYPLATGAGHSEHGDALATATEDILSVLQAQPWEMIHWRDAARGLSYRRFFEITGLVGVRVEDPAVFDATHRLILELVADGRVQGLRVDHIDGLADPAAYLRRLRDAVGPDVYLVVEKILEGDEQLPEDWPVEGTTGYEFIADLASVLTDGAPELDRAWQQAAPDFAEPDHELQRAKRLLVEVNFEGEIESLVRRASSIAQSEAAESISVGMLREAVRALVAGFEVYRTYGTADGLGSHDRQVLEELSRRLASGSPDLRPALALLENVLLGRVGDQSREAALAFLTRLQHLTGPVLAKSLEDTFFYRYNRLIALNEVGGDPIGRTGGIDHFHRRMQLRHATQPNGLSATSTHDTKRGEDARARLYAISEAPEDWVALTARWRQKLAGHVVALKDGPAPAPAVEWLLFQALAGMLPGDFDPSSQRARDAALHRFLPYVEKALREAKLRTNWTDINAPYEQAVKDYAAAMIGSAVFMTGFWSDIQPFIMTGKLNSLAQTVIKLAAPGIPDIYQGTEGPDTSLVDPDNRCMPDYAGLVPPGRAPSSEDFAGTKTWLIRRGLALRRRYPALFTHGDYVPLESIGQRRENVLAFARKHGEQMAVVAVPRLVHDAIASATLMSKDHWGDTAILLPPGIDRMRDGWSDDTDILFDGRAAVSDLFRARPFALLVADR